MKFGIAPKALLQTGVGGNFQGVATHRKTTVK